MKQQGLGPAQLIGDVAVAGGLAGLPLQAGKLAVQGADDVVQPLQVGFGGAQAQFGFVPPGMQPGDPRGLLQQVTAIRWLGVDDGADPALADEGRGAGSGGQVGEEELDVLGPHRLAVDSVVGALFTLDPAGDLDLFVVVEARRGVAAAVIEVQHDLGQIARGTASAAAENDVVHFAAAHALGGGLSHYPAQGFDEVGLAATVRADHAGRAAFDHELGRVDEGLEAGQAKLNELNQVTLGLPSGPAARLGTDRLRPDRNRSLRLGRLPRATPHRKFRNPWRRRSSAYLRRASASS